jgi:hypothetical protein
MGDSVYNSFTRSNDPLGYYPPNNSSQDDSQSQSLRQSENTNDNF